MTDRRTLSRQFSEVLDRQPSRALSDAASRGKTPLEKKSAWPFDFYQVGDFYPVDYHYWWHPVNTTTGISQLTMIHAVAYASDGNPFAADQAQHRPSMKKAHLKAMAAFQKHSS